MFLPTPIPSAVSVFVPPQVTMLAYLHGEGIALAFGMSDAASFRLELEEFWRERFQDAAEPEGQAEFRSRRQNRALFFTEEVYVNLIAAIEQILWLNAHAELSVTEEMPLAAEYGEGLFDGVRNLSIAASLAHGSAPESVLSLINASLHALPEADPGLPINAGALGKLSDAFIALGKSLQSPGRGHLRNTPAPKAKALAARNW